MKDNLELVLGADQFVADWITKKMQWGACFGYDRCLGVIDEDKNLKGAIFIAGYNGADIQFSYYGENTLRPWIVKFLAKFIIQEFDPSRVTFIVTKRNKRLIRSLQRFGCKLEGVQHCYYGKQDCNRNTGVRLVMFRNRLDQLASFSLKKVA